MIWYIYISAKFRERSFISLEYSVLTQQANYTALPATVLKLFQNSPTGPDGPYSALSLTKSSLA